MTLTLTSEQLSLLQYANDARDFDGYIYNTERNTPPSGWVQDTRFIINDSSTGLYAEVWTKGNTTMFVIRGTEMGDSGDLSNDLQMLEGKVGQQNLKFCQWFQQNQGQFEGQRVIFTGNSAAATNAESAAAIFGKEAIGTNGYGYQPNINDLANALGVSVSTNPSDYANRIINFITQSDLVGNAGTHLGLNLYVPEPNDIWQSLKNLPPSPLSAFINAYYYAYDGHLPYNFNDYDLTNPSADSRITDEPSSTAKFFNNFGESLRTLLSGLDDVAISAATIAVTGTALNPIIKLGLGLITYTFNSDNSLSIAPSTLNGLSRRELAQIASSLLFSSTNNNFNRINVENGINDYFITKDMHGTLLYESATVNGQLLTPEVYEIMQGALTGGAANLNYKMNFFGLSSFDPLRGFFNIANSVINGLGSLFDHIMNFFNPIGAFYEGGTLPYDETKSIADKTGQILLNNNELSTTGLLALDSNHDNKIDNTDLQYSNLKIWQDMDEDGIADTGEIKTLADAGLTSINLNIADLFSQGNANTAINPSLYAGTKLAPMDYAYWRSQCTYVIPWNGLLYSYSPNGPLLNYAGTVAVGTSGNDNFDAMYWNVRPYNLFYNLGAIQSFLAGAGDDTMGGNDSNNNIFGGAGNDQLIGYGGNDYIDGEIGDDRILGSLGNDTIYGGDGNDEISGRDADDIKVPLLAGQTDNDLIFGEAGNDAVYGREGDDIIFGGLGNDTLVGGIGDDTVYGGEGDDLVLGYNPDFWLRDGVEYPAENTVEAGESDNNRLYGGEGNDTVTGGAGNDYIDGGAGADLMRGNYGDDIFIVNSINDNIIENQEEGYDKVYSSVTYILGTEVEELNLLGNENIHATGNKVNNKIVGNDGDNIIDGVTGADTMYGGKGDDVYYADDIGDTVIEKTNEGIDNVQASISYTLSDNVENLNLLSYFTPEKGLIDQENVLVYGYPKRYELDYIQGNGNPQYKGTCALTAISNIFIEGGLNISEAQVVNYAIENNLCVTEYESDDKYQRGGSNMREQMQVLEGFNMTTQGYTYYDAVLIAEKIKAGYGVILGVNGGKLWDNNQYLDDGSVNHVITVSGVVYNSDNTQIKGFYICDSGRSMVSDMTRYISLAQFEACANVGNAYSIITEQKIKFWDININGTGNDLDNKIVGTEGNNILNGGLGSDVMIGGKGNDTYYIDNTEDLVIENPNEGNDTLRSGISCDLNNNINIENLELLGNSNLTAKGSSIDNIVIGNSGNNSLEGGLGNDILNGASGDDTYLFSRGDGQDTINDASGINKIIFGQDVLQADIKFGVSNYDLLISNVISGDKITVIDWFKSDNNKISEIYFTNDNTTLLANEINSKIDSLAQDFIANNLGKILLNNASVTEQELKNLDSNGNGLIESNDSQWNKLTIWQDLNENGIAETGEIRALLAAGKTAIRIEDADVYTSGSSNYAPSAQLVIPETPSVTLPAKKIKSTSLYGNVTATGRTNINLYGYGNDTAEYYTLTTNSDYFDTKGGNDTISASGGNDAIYAGSGDDIIWGDAGNDYINGGTGNDFLLGNGGNNFIDGDIGNDTLLAGSGTGDYIFCGAGDDIVNNYSIANGEPVGAGNDYIDGESGNDALLGNGGNDTIWGGDGLDEIQGNEGNDYLFGEANNDSVFGQVGNDTLSGGDGNDTICGFTGDNETKQNLSTGESDNDVLLGDTGADLIIGCVGNDLLIGGDGNDTIFAYYQTARAATINLLPNETDDDTVYGGQGDDAIDGGYGNDVIYAGTDMDTVIGGNGNDLIYGQQGSDELYGNDGADTLYGGTENDTLGGSGGNDLLFGEDGNDSISGSSGDDTVYGGQGDDIIYGNNIENSEITQGEFDNNKLYGELGSDTIFGGIGNDYIDGGAGSDAMSGGLGNDIFVVNSFSDSVIEHAGEGQDKVFSNINYFLGENIENLKLLGSDNLNGTGNALSNEIIGNSGNNILDGGIGIDRMFGQEGNDTYYVDDINDSVVEKLNEGADIIYSSVNYGLVDNVENLTLIGSSDINGTGNGLNNVIIGNFAKNILDGGIGADALFGGLNDDTYYVDNIGDIVTENLNEGTDTINSSISYTLTNNVENLILTGSATSGEGNDLSNYLTGNTSSNVLSGGGGNDSLNGGTGSDTLNGGIGNDLLDGGVGNDSLVGADGDDVYIIDNTDDIITELSSQGYDTAKSSVSYTLSTNIEELILTGSDNISAYGNNENNVVRGNSGNNIIDGGVGVDNLLGGKGNDIYIVDNSNDTIFENSDEGVDLVKASASYTLSNNIENLELNGVNNINATGNILNNFITGNTGDNILDGGLGNDTLIGVAGDDTYLFLSGWGDDIAVDSSGNDKIKFDFNISKDDLDCSKNGNDLIISQKGTTNKITIQNWFASDVNKIELFEFMNGTILSSLDIERLIPNNITISTGDNTVTGTDSRDVVTTGSGNDTINSGNGDDIINAGSGSNIINTGAGDDVITTGTGSDIINAGAGNDIINLNSDVTWISGYAARNKGSISTQGTSESITLTGMMCSHNVFDSGEGQDRLNLSNNNDALFLDDSFSSTPASGARLQNFEEIYAGAGDDIIDLTSDTWNVGNMSLYGGDGNDTIWSSAGNDLIYGESGNDKLYGDAGNDSMYGGTGDDIYQFSVNNGNDTISDTQGNDVIELRSYNIRKNNVAFFKDGNNLVIDYGTNSQITIENQSLATNSIEKVKLYGGQYLTDSDINNLIQQISAYATSNGISLTSIDSVKNDQNLMAMCTTAWHS